MGTDKPTINPVIAHGPQSHNGVSHELLEQRRDALLAQLRSAGKELGDGLEKLLAQMIKDDLARQLASQPDPAQTATGGENTENPASDQRGEARERAPTCPLLQAPEAPHPSSSR